MSIAAHLIALIALVLWPSNWPELLAVILADHLFIAASVFRPRSQLFGPNLVRLPAAAIARGEVGITFDDGPDAEVTPQVLDLLDRHSATATFFCVASRALAHPALMQEIVRRGHDIQNHSFGHAYSFPARGVLAMRRDVAQAQHTLGRLTGRVPSLFRAPMGFRSPFLEPAIAASGLQFVSWTRRGFDTRERDPEKVLARLGRDLRAGDILLLHDRGSAIAVNGRPVVLEVLPRLLERLSQNKLKAVSLGKALEENG